MKIEVIFLGTNGWYATNLGNTISTLISTKDFYILLDAGDGIYKIDQYITADKPIVLLLSHLHLDHIIGLHTFAKFAFKQKIDIYGYTGTKNRINQIIDHPFSSPFKGLQLDIHIHDLNEGQHEIGFPITCKLLVHADPCLGYRISLENKIITYCTDTGLCPAIYDLAQNADILITESSYKPGQEKWGWPHYRGGWCVRCKTATANKFARAVGCTHECIGFSTSEKNRTGRITLDDKKWTVRYPLIEYGIDKKEALVYCKSLGYDWNGLYDVFDRVSCWCCPKAGLKNIEKIKINFPKLYERFLEMDEKAKKVWEFPNFF